MNEEIESTIKKIAHRDIIIKMMDKELAGLIITKEVVLDIIKELENNELHD